MTSRKLVDGLKSELTSKQAEKDFVFQEKDNTKSKDAEVKSASGTSTSETSDSMQQIPGRVPVTTRCRPELATRLKQASLQRQLNGESPYYVQDIMEEALEQWLLAHGCL